MYFYKETICTSAQSAPSSTSTLPITVRKVDKTHSDDLHEANNSIENLGRKRSCDHLPQLAYDDTSSPNDSTPNKQGSKQTILYINKHNQHLW